MLNAALLAVACLLLAVILWRVEAVHEEVERPELSGQWVEAEGVRTERWVDESLEDWLARHQRAVRRAREVREQ